MELLTTVPKEAVSIQKRRMYTYLNESKQVDVRRSYRELNDAYRALNIATGFYQVLNGLGLIDSRDMVGEDIERIKTKIEDIVSEKRRSDMIRRH